MPAFIALFCTVFLFSAHPVVALEFLYPEQIKQDNDQDLPENTSLQPQKLTIYSTTDNSAMREVLLDFQSLYPRISINYHELQSLEVFQRVQEDKIDQGADITISSAMDLQMKLVNDGFAQSVNLTTEFDLPNWATWRDEAYGITLEPAVIIYYKPYFKDRPLPRNRAELIRFLENSPAGLKGSLATYDIEKSGLGYLFLSRDDSQYSATWDLVRALGNNDVTLLSQSSQIIDGVASGKFKLGYNVLGTYAISRLQNNPDLGVILPEDYTTVFTRLAFIPKTAQSPSMGKQFLEYLLSKRGQKLLSEKAQLNAIHTDVQNIPAQFKELYDDNRSLRPINVSPGLLVYLDQMKKKTMLQRWRKALNLKP
ncbi:ABC transporter substrate-binding protein [Terasakiella sp. A23]|uniref:ABC transporter substrate-binding protein n=1 Tax=Terasakiella sp. FCG-A23 TaxID=3080561 RepID=UPI0029536BF8|nr:ABC transporter substrate-binding protein [Terasakiella sp. A23]MDV7340223.1 ABC transporter substrate-binding protein [Terasakiella sp. A23]